MGTWTNQNYLRMMKLFGLNMRLFGAKGTIQYEHDQHVTNMTECGGEMMSSKMCRDGELAFRLGTCLPGRGICWRCRWADTDGRPMDRIHGFTNWAGYQRFWSYLGTAAWVRLGVLYTTASGTIEALHRRLLRGIHRRNAHSLASCFSYTLYILR